MIANAFGPKEQIIYKHIATGAMWNEKEIARISDENHYCKHCCENAEDSVHTLWKCCAINKHRTFNALTQLCIEGIPKAILYGIPLAMGWEITKPFWHKSDEGQHADNETGARNTRIDQAREAEIMNLIETNAIDKKCNARQVIMQMKHQEGDHEEVTLPYKCTKKPPTKINVFSDGSWMTPTKRFYPWVELESGGQEEH